MMNTRYLTILASSLILQVSCGTDERPATSQQAAVIPNTAQTELRWGSGINVDTEDTFEECIDMSKAVFKPMDGQPENEANMPSMDLKLDVRSISSYQEIDQFTNTSVAGNIKTASYGGGFSYNGTELYKLSSDLATVGIMASADYGRWYLSDVKLKKEFEDLFNRDPESFFRRCGTEYVSGYRRGQGISVLLSTASRSELSFEQISASANASAKIGMNSGSISASFLNVATELLKLGSLNVQVRAYGAGEISTLSSLIKSNADVQSLAKEISDIISKMEFKQSSRYMILTSPYPGIDYSNHKASPILREHRRRVLQELFADYRLLSQDLSRVNAIIRKGSSFLPPNSDGLCEYATAQTGTCEQYLAKLDKAKEKIEKAIEQIDDLSRQCADALHVRDCKTASAVNIRALDLSIKQWEQQYRKMLILEFLKAHLNP